MIWIFLPPITTPRTLIVELAGCASRLTSLNRFCTGITLSTTCGNSVIRLSSD